MIFTELEKREFQRYYEMFPLFEGLRNRKLLITGANGMTCTGMIKWLLYVNEKDGLDLKIYASTRHPEKKPDYVEESDPITFCRFGEEEAALQKTTVDYIIQGAAPTQREFFLNNPVETIRVIVDETERLLDFCRRQPGCRLLYISSMDVYGAVEREQPIPEDFEVRTNPLVKRNCYSIGKITAEYLCKAYAEEYGVKTVVVRPASIQGLFQPRQEPRVINELLQCILDGRDFVLKSDGTGKKCFLYSMDAIAGILTALLRGKDGETYNITNPESFIELKCLGARVLKTYAPNLSLRLEVEDNAKNGFAPKTAFVQDTKKLEQLGWSCKTGILDIYGIDLERFKGE